MGKAIRSNLAVLTLLAALVGGMVSSVFRWHISHATAPMTADELLREIETGNGMPVIAASTAITSRFPGPSTDVGGPIPLVAKDKAKLFIPDKYALAAMVCETTDEQFHRILTDYGQTWFSGAVSGAVTSVRLTSAQHIGEITLEGSVYQCRGTRTMPIASGIKVRLPIQEVDSGGLIVRSSTAWIAYPAALADLFISFLLMVFVPTLTLSIMKAVLDSAQSNHGTGRLFRYSFSYFAITTLVAGAIGTAAGYISYRSQPSQANLRDIASVSIGNQVSAAEYDAHPILSQLTGIIPTNPLEALSNPDGNKGLQVAFLAVMIGLLLTVIGEEQRTRISQWLKNTLALIVKDTDLKWRAISDWADLLTPAGVFFISLKFGATVSYAFLWEMLTMILMILAALVAQSALLLAWVITRRKWREWFHLGLIPGVPGLLTALATSSSYAALPGIAATPLLSGSSSRRGVFDFCATINKNGTTIYIATVASYVLFYRLHGAVTSLLFVVLVLAGLASVATAGLPFAAVFGLRMVLLATNSPGGLAWAILPIDPLVDRFVTVVNVFSNLAACSESRTTIQATSADSLPPEEPNCQTAAA